jgi:hypothetical protein
MEWKARSTLPFYREVYGHDIHRTTPLEVKNSREGAIVDLTDIVALDNFDGAARLCGYIRQKIRHSRETIRF